MNAVKERTRLAEIFGAQVHARRKALQMKQEALARTVGYETHSNIAKIEKGVALPSFDKAVAIAEALDISLADLLSSEKPSSQSCFSRFLLRWPAHRREESVAFLRAMADEIERLSVCS